MSISTIFSCFNNFKDTQFIFKNIYYFRLFWGSNHSPFALVLSIYTDVTTKQSKNTMPITFFILQFIYLFVCISVRFWQYRLTQNSQSFVIIWKVFFVKILVKMQSPYWFQTPNIHAEMPIPLEMFILIMWIYDHLILTIPNWYKIISLVKQYSWWCMNRVIFIRPLGI